MTPTETVQGYRTALRRGDRRPPGNLRLPDFTTRDGRVPSADERCFAPTNSRPLHSH